MKKLLVAFAFIGLVACGSEAPAPKESSIEEVPTLSDEAPAPDVDVDGQDGEAFEAAARACPWYAPRCCGVLRSDGTCVGNCVARNAECP